MVLRNDTSRMMGDYHVRFCERLEGETPSCLLGVFLGPLWPKFFGHKGHKGHDVVSLDHPNPIGNSWQKLNEG